MKRGIDRFAYRLTMSGYALGVILALVAAFAAGFFMK